MVLMTLMFSILHNRPNYSIVNCDILDFYNKKISPRLFSHTDIHDNIHRTTVDMGEHVQSYDHAYDKV